MADELPDLPSLRVIDPPPGGLEALRDKLDARRRRWWLIALPVAAIAAVSVLLLSNGRTTIAPPATEAPPTAIRDRGVADTFYWVASTPGAPRRARSNAISIDEAPTVTAYALP